MLVEAGSSTESLEPKNGFTPLQFTLDLLCKSTCSSHSSMLTRVVETLLNLPQVDVTNCGLYGPSPLELAVLTSQPSIIFSIISKGGSRLAQDDIQVALEHMQTSFTGSTDARQSIIAALSTLIGAKISSSENPSTVHDQRLPGAISRTSHSSQTKKARQDHVKNVCFGIKAQDYLKMF